VTFFLSQFFFQFLIKIIPPPPENAIYYVVDHFFIALFYTKIAIFGSDSYVRIIFLEIMIEIMLEFFFLECIFLRKNYLRKSYDRKISKLEFFDRIFPRILDRIFCKKNMIK
jgi:hypothetical protein